MSLLKRIGETASFEDGMINVPMVMERYDLNRAEEGNLLFLEKSGSAFSSFDHPAFPDSPYLSTNLTSVFLGEKVFPFKQKRKIAREQVVFLPKSLVLKRDPENIYQYLEELTGHWITGFEFYGANEAVLDWVRERSLFPWEIFKGEVHLATVQKQEEKSYE